MTQRVSGREEGGENPRKKATFRSATSRTGAKKAGVLKSKSKSKSTVTTKAKSSRVLSLGTKDSKVEPIGRPASFTKLVSLGAGRGQRADEAIDRLAGSARRSDEAAGFVVDLLAAVADLAEAHQAPGAMPADETALWESVGARFDDRDARTRALARGAAAFADLLAQSFTTEEVVELLGVDRSRISQRLSDGSLYAVTHGDGRRFPSWQFNENATLQGLKEVLTALDPGLHPLTVDHWFTHPNFELDIDGDAVSPVEWLRTGGSAGTVAALAAQL